MKFLNFSVSATDNGDVELVFFTLGPFAFGVRLDKVSKRLAKFLRPNLMN